MSDLQDCFSSVQRVFGLLNEKRGSGDVSEFLVTVSYVSDVLSDFRQANVSLDVSKVKSYLQEYEQLLLQLVKDNKFTRFITSNRVRKKLEILNSNLHMEVTHLFVQLRKLERTSAAAPQPTVNLRPRTNTNATLQKVLGALEPDARHMWESFGGNPMVKWSQFLQTYTRAVNQSVNEPSLKYLLDNSGTGTVSVSKFAEFLKGFGPLRESPRRVQSVVSQDWFHGYLSSEESERLLTGCKPKTFLIRISKSKLGSFALAYVNESGGFTHTLISPAPNNQFKIVTDDSGQADQLYPSLHDVISHYAFMLQFPFNSQLAREAWFHGDLSSAEAQDMLKDTLEGTFLFRFSSYPGCLAVSYLKQGNVLHGKVQLSNIGFRFESEAKEYLSLQALVEDYDNILKQPLENTAFPSGQSRSNGAHQPSNAPNTYQSVPRNSSSSHNGDAAQAPTDYQPLPSQAQMMASGGIASPVLERVPPHVQSPGWVSEAEGDYGSLNILLGAGRGGGGGGVGGGRGRGRGASVRNSPARTPSRDTTPYGSIPVGEVKGSPAAALSTSGEYGALPVGIIQRPNRSPASKDYGSVPVDIANAAHRPYGSVPASPANTPGTGQYGSVPNNGVQHPYGDVPQRGAVGAYGELPAGFRAANLPAASPNYGSVPQTDPQTGAPQPVKGYGRLPGSSR